MTIAWKNCFRVGVSAFILYICIHYFKAVSNVFSLLAGAVTPILAGLALAYVLNILMSVYERHYFKGHSGSKLVRATKRPVCTFAAFLTLCAIIAAVIGLVIPELISCVKFLISETAPAVEKVIRDERITKYLSHDVLSKLYDVNWEDYISKIVKIITTGLGGTVNTIVTALSSAVSAVITAFIGIIFAIYLLLGRDKLQNQCTVLLKTYLPPKWTKTIMHWLRVFNESFHRYIVGQCTEAVILGVLCIVGMLIFRLPYAVMIGTLVGFTALIPVAGAYFGAIVGAVMILTVSPVKALIFIIFLVVLQQLENNLIYPRVVGKSIGLPSVWVLAAITVGGGIMGVFGMVLGVPAFSAVYHLVREDVLKRQLQKKKAPAKNL